MIREQIQKIILEAMARAYPGVSREIELTASANSQYGDFTTNVALTLAGSLKEKPQAIAAKIRDSLADQGGLLQSSSIAGPGFLNFTVSPVRWIESLRDVFFAGQHFGRTGDLGKKAAVEFVHLL